jgi:hypothetical protein
VRRGARYLQLEEEKHILGLNVPVHEREASLGFRVSGLGFTGLRVSDLGFRVWGLGFWEVEVPL